MNGSMAMSPPMPKSKAKMHMTFFWGKDAYILFTNWPGTNTGMYVLALVFVFLMAFLVEFIAHCRFIKSGSRAASLVRSVNYGVQIGLAYMVMLALMSFNGGVVIVALMGHAFGFFFFGSNIFRKSDAAEGAKACGFC